MKVDAKRTSIVEPGAPVEAVRLYQKLARRLFNDLAAGKYEIGARLPAERELAAIHNVSRPAVREAMIALEVQGLIEVKIGSGAYVKSLPGTNDRPGFNPTAFELTEARLMFEGEAAALAATQITDTELDELDDIIQRIAQENEQPEIGDKADHEFHLLIARATRNGVILETVERLWEMRSSSPECALLHEKARDAEVRPVVAEHAAIALALRARNPAAARAAMRSHLIQVMEHLLFATEERAVAQARNSVASKRERFSQSAAY